MRTAKTFSYNGLKVRVGCVDQMQLAWIEEFLSPAFAPAEDGTADCTVTLEIDDRRYASVLGWGARPDGLRLACCAFDSGLVHMPLWGPPDQSRVIFDEDSQVFYFVNEDATQVRLLSASGHASRRIALMRVVREFAMSSSWTGRRFVLHAGACELAGSGIIIAGPKGAGKTTLLMYALGCRDARFVANDRVVVDVDGSQPVVRGMPTVVSIRYQTLRRFPEFERRWLRHRYNERMALHEAPGEGIPRRAEPLNLTPAQFSVLLGVPMRDAAPARAVLFPRLNEAIEGVRVQEISAEAGSRRLAESIFAANSPRKISEVFALSSHGSQASPAIVDELSRVLTRAVRCFDCQLGRPVPHTLDDIENCLAQLLPSPPTPTNAPLSGCRS